MNRVCLIGRLTKSPELRYTTGGTATTTFTLACDRPFSNNGQKEADFIPIVTWKQTAEACANYLSKGKLVAVEGRIQVRNYENNEKKRVYVTEVIADNVRFLERNQTEEFTTNSEQAVDKRDPFANDSNPIDLSDERLPF